MDRELIDKILTYLMIGGILYALVYFALRDVGIIETPLVLELTPWIAALFGIIVIFWKAVAFVEIMKPLPQRVDRIAKGLTKLEIRFDHFEKEFHDLKLDFNALSRKTAKIAEKVDYLSKCKNFSPA